MKESDAIPARPDAPAAVSPARPPRTAPFWLSLTLLFLLAALPRLVVAASLPVGQPQWLARAELFWNELCAGRWSTAAPAPHPGLTYLWWVGGALRLLGSETLREKALLASVACTLLNLALLALLLAGILRELRSASVAFAPLATLLAGVLLALDPLVVAMTGQAGIDGIFSLLFVAAIPAVMRALRDPARRSAWPAAALSCAATATKGVGLLAILFPLLVAGGPAVDRRRRLRLSAWIAITIVAGVALALPPAWVDPIHTTKRLLVGETPADESLLGVLRNDRRETLLGSKDASPASAYAANLLFRTTPLALVGALAALALPTIRSLALGRTLFGVFLLLFAALCFAAQREWRYLLPLFVMLDVLGGLGLAGWVHRASGTRGRRAALALVVIGLAVQSAWVLSAAPYFEFRLNPIVGGLPTARHWIPVGWGAGLERAHAALSDESTRLGRPIRWTGGYRPAGEQDRKGLEFEPAGSIWQGHWAKPPDADCRVFYVRNNESTEREQRAYWATVGVLVYELRIDGVPITDVWCATDTGAPAGGPGARGR